MRQRNQLAEKVAVRCIVEDEVFADITGDYVIRIEQ